MCTCYFSGFTMKISFKSAAEAYSDLKLGSISNPSIKSSLGSKEARVFTAATLLLKDASVYINPEPSNKVSFQSHFM